MVTIDAADVYVLSLIGAYVVSWPSPSLGEAFTTKSFGCRLSLQSLNYNYLRLRIY